MGESETPLLSLEGIEYEYEPGRPVLRGVDLEVRGGEAVALLGASGSGKSTLLSIAGLLTTPGAGRQRVRDEDIASLDERGRERLRNRALGFVFQHHFLLPDFRVRENVAMPCWIQAGRHQAEALERADQVLERMGIGHLGDRLPHQLSGGERQRAALARALAHDPALVLADEPTGSLDSENGQVVLDLLLGLRTDSSRGVLIVTHNPRVAEACDRRVLIQDGRIADA